MTKGAEVCTECKRGREEQRAVSAFRALESEGLERLLETSKELYGAIAMMSAKQFILEYDP